MDEVIRNHRRIAEAASEFTIEQESL